MVQYRQAPFDVEAEQALLGAILVNNDAFERVSGFLEPEHFHEPMHQRIFEALTRVIRKGQLASPVTLRPYFALDAAVKDVLARAASRPGHIFNLGHGLHPQTPVEGVQRAVDAVRKLSARATADAELAGAR